MAELVDALASGASVRMDVEVRVLFWAPSFPIIVVKHTWYQRIYRCGYPDGGVVGVDSQSRHRYR